MVSKTQMLVFTFYLLVLSHLVEESAAFMSGGGGRRKRNEVKADDTVVNEKRECLKQPRKVGLLIQLYF